MPPGLRKVSNGELIRYFLHLTEIATSLATNSTYSCQMYVLIPLHFSVVPERLCNNCRTARWRALVAGAVAGPALLLTGRDKRHTSLAIYILMRAAVLAARCGIKNEKAGWLFRPLKWRHGDTFLMCLSASQIL